ncbi:MAG: hypothetical protein A3F12_03590 [Gammaproteobacteria bacterium RIFCSPHIGHO2_12_FULL_38_14]|nr:MAG: hypothetical protein A3F12_03590 [Gammaproteobacteria bacterium RIFCSPHIGHO2_12_FULL_38_14]
MRSVAALDAYLYDEIIGTLMQLPDDRIIFNFSVDYIKKQHRPVLSQSFYNNKKELITSLPPTKTKAPPYFANLLPEGHLRKYLAMCGKINENRDFPLLKLFGNDLPGALVLKPSSTIHVPLSSIDIQLEKNYADETVLKFSLAGIQLKLSAIIGTRGGLTIPAHGVGGNWIVKLPSIHFQHVNENEFSMLTLAGAIGISVPEIRLMNLNDIHHLPELPDNLAGKILVVKRFDREKKQRIHTEDFAQVYNVYPHKKYEGVNYSNLTSMIESVSSREQAAQFIKRVVFNILIGNGDMHLKNWSFIYYDKVNPILSPAYDYVATHLYIPEDSFSFNFGGEKQFSRINREHLKKFSEKALLPFEWVDHITQETIQLTTEKWNELSPDFPLNKTTTKKIEKHIMMVSLNLG